MGKNNHQIATFADLYSIGYRVPSGKETSKECVTYDDLKAMTDTPNAALYHSYYNDKSVFTITYTSDVEGTTLSGNTHVTSDSLGHFTTPSCDLNTKISYFPTLYPRFIITAPQSNRFEGTMTLTLLIEDSSGNVQVLDSTINYITINSGTTDNNGGWTKNNNGYTWNSIVYFGNDCAHIQVKPNTLYYIKVRVYFAPKVMLTQYGPHNISFLNGYNSSDIKYYSADKCVPWRYINT